MVVYLALGSNLGDRETNLKSALLGLEVRGVQIRRRASLYLTEPRDVLDQPWFLNTVVQADTSLLPEALLAVCLDVEEENLRQRAADKGPRTIDIDIIFYGTHIIQKPGLVVPHPRFSNRRFVLGPLAEIAGEFVDPVSGKTIRQLLEASTDIGEVRRLESRSF
jgi:2-amino-4-hydroxy-6-hydroxymethyldihydropteridine diphosphokinase